MGTFLGVPEGDISAPFVSEKGIFIFQKENDNNINYPANFTRYQQLINKDHDSKVDLLLVDILKKENVIVDNRFNFY